MSTNLKKFFIRQKIGKRVILMSTTDRTQIQSVTVSLSYECIKLREYKVQSTAETD